MCSRSIRDGAGSTWERKGATWVYRLEGAVVMEKARPFPWHTVSVDSSAHLVSLPLENVGGGRYRESAAGGA